MAGFVTVQATLFVKHRRDCAFSLFQLAETSDPGTFKAWVLVGADLHAIKVNVPRIFYVNCHTPKEGAGTSKSSSLFKGPGPVF